MSIGFKEWALVCEALGGGTQSIILRKGGIAEGRAGFRFQHEEFLLFPTLYHEQAAKLKLPPETPLPAREEGAVTIQFFARVEWTELITDLELLPKLAPFHIWKDSEIEQRFRYDEPQGVNLAFVRIFRVDPVWTFPDSPKYGGVPLVGHAARRAAGNAPRAGIGPRRSHPPRGGIARDPGRRGLSGSGIPGCDSLADEGLCLTLKASVRLQPLTPRFVFRINNAQTSAKRNVLVRLEGEDGVAGYGEGAPSKFFGESVDEIVPCFERAAEWLRGLDVRSVADIERAWHAWEWLKPFRSAQCALDLALWDLLAKREGRSVAALALGKAPLPVKSFATIGFPTPKN